MHCLYLVFPFLGGGDFVHRRISTKHDVSEGGSASVRRKEILMCLNKYIKQQM
jgi:hypothetical protein